MEAQLIEKIESYLSGDINKDQLQQYAIDHNIQDLDQEIEWVENAQLAIEANGLKLQLSEVLKSNKKETAKIKPITKTFSLGKFTSLSIAAAVVLLFGILFLFKPTNTEKLYSKYEFLDPGIPVLMSETNRFEMYEALSYYSEQNYQETIKRLSELKSKSTYNDTLEFYLGVSNLYEKNIAESLPLIEKVSDDENSIFKERAEWLLVLAHVKNGDKLIAKSLLEPIESNPEHPFYKQALALSTDLK
ncbi:MAG: hypothetical protein R2753_03000 [Chitinophagales bacterium]